MTARVFVISPLVVHGAIKRSRVQIIIITLYPVYLENYEPLSIWLINRLYEGL